MKTKHWVIIFSLVLLSCAAIVWLSFSGGDKNTAAVYLDGELIREIDLDKVSEAYEFTVADGGNTITVSPDGIWVSEATCPDLTCVKHGQLSGSAPIVCLPHRLVIKWSAPQGDFDARAGG